MAALNYVADPFGILLAGYDSRPLDRDSFDDNTRLAKAQIVSRLRPEAIVLGTSRAEIGISPAHPAWRYRHVYNLGLPHASLHEMREYLEHAIAASRLRQVVIGLDFLQFNPMLEPRPDFEVCRLRDPGSPWTRVRSALCDLPALFASRAATSSSIALLWEEARDSVYLRDGSRNAAAKEALVRNAGSQHAAFLRSELEFFENIELVRGFIESEARFEEVAGPEFEALLRTAHRHEVDLRLFFSPTHARHDALLFDMGLIDDYIRWKRFVVETMERVAAEYGDAPYKVWDFSDATRITTEELPALDDADSRMHWHWESSHYTRALGDLILSHVLGNHDSAAGRRLTPQNLDEWIAAVHRRHAAYREAARSELELMRAYVRSAAKREQVDRMLQRQNWK